MQATADAEQALLALHDANGIGTGETPPVDMGQTLYYCDGYRIIDDPETGTEVHAVLRKRALGQTVRFVIGYTALQEEMAHLQEHADSPDPNQHHGLSAEFFSAAAAELAVAEKIMSPFEARLKHGENPKVIAAELMKISAG